MKKYFAFIFMIVFLFMGYSQAIPDDQQLIRTTGFTVHAAHKMALSSGTSLTNLGKCIEHQRHAVSKFKLGNKTQAIYHSAYAREMAFTIITANGGKIHQTFEFSDAEKTLFAGSPTHEILDAVIIGKLLSDNEYLVSQMEVNHAVIVRRNRRKWSR